MRRGEVPVMTAGEVIWALTLAVGLLSVGFMLGTIAESNFRDWCDEQRRRRAPRAVWKTTTTREEADRGDR